MGVLRVLRGSNTHFLPPRRKERQEDGYTNTCPSSASNEAASQGRGTGAFCPCPRTEGACPCPEGACPRTSRACPQFTRACPHNSHFHHKKTARAGCPSPRRADAHSLKIPANTSHPAPPPRTSHPSRPGRPHTCRQKPHPRRPRAIRSRSSAPWHAPASFRPEAARSPW